MRGLFDIKKIIGKGVILGLLLLLSNTAYVLSAEAKDEPYLPKCSLVEAGTQKCICEEGGWLSNDLICDVGQACVVTTDTASQASGGLSFTSYSCVAVDVAMDKVAGTKEFSGDFWNYSTEDIVAVNDDTFCTDRKTKCSPYCKYKDQVKNSCTLCPLFILVFNTVSQIGDIAISTFSPTVAKLVVVGFGIWLALQVLAFVSAFETRDLKDLVSAIVNQGFVVMLVFLILQSGAGNFYATFINPVYNSGQLVAQAMFDSTPAETKNFSVDEGNDEAEDSDSTSELKPGSLPVEMGQSIVTTMTMMENHVRKFKALGSAMMCQSWLDKTILVPKFIYLFTGLILWALTMVLIIGIPFLMVDAVFQLGVAMALLPVAIGGFAFKMTRQYTKKVWETFLNSMFAFVFISIVVLLVLATLQEAVMAGVDAIDLPDGATFDGMFERAGAEAAVYFDVILQSFQWASLHFIRLACVLLLAWSVMNMAKEFADEFASSISDTAIGSSIGTMAASTAKGMALKAAAPTRHFIKNKTKEGIENIPGAFRRAKGHHNYNKSIKKFNDVAAQDGKKSFTDKKGVVHTLENNVVSEKKGNVTTYRSKDMTIVRTERVVNGKTVYEDKVSFNNKSLQELVAKDGKFNQQKLNDMLKGMNNEQKEIFRAAAFQEIEKERFAPEAYNLGKAGHTAQTEVISASDSERITKTTAANGETILRKTKVLANGYLETTITRIDNKGVAKIMSSDGIHNKMTEFKLSADVNVASLHSAEDVFRAREKDSKGNYKATRTLYGYTKEYRKAIDRGLRWEDIDRGMLSEEEAKACHSFHNSPGHEFQKAKMHIHFK